MTRLLGSSVLAAVIAVFGSGCGGSSSSAPAISPGGAVTGSASESEGTIPPALLGTWTTTLKANDLPANPPPELDGSTKWHLQIAETGGVDNGPVLSIANDLGQLEGPTPQGKRQ